MAGRKPRRKSVRIHFLHDRQPFHSDKYFNPPPDLGLEMVGDRAGIGCGYFSGVACQQSPRFRNITPIKGNSKTRFLAREPLRSPAPVALSGASKIATRPPNQGSAKKKKKKTTRTHARLPPSTPTRLQHSISSAPRLPSLPPCVCAFCVSCSREQPTPIHPSIHPSVRPFSPAGRIFDCPPSTSSYSVRSVYTARPTA